MSQNKQGFISSSFKAAHGGLKSMGYVGVGMTALDFKSNLDQGQGAGTALVKSAASYAAWTMASPLMWAYTGATTGYEVANSAYTWRRQQAENWNKALRPDYSVGGNYQDTAAAQTMRQAAVQAIQGSRLNARSALGGEARIFHNNTPRQW